MSKTANLTFQRTEIVAEDTVQKKIWEDKEREFIRMYRALTKSKKELVFGVCEVAYRGQEREIRLANESPEKFRNRA